MKRSKFSLSHYKLASFYMGELVPLTWVEVLPGDTFQQVSNLLIRVSPLLAPVMHPVHVTIHHWYVPLRIIWPNVEKFITGGPDGFDATVPPYITTENPSAWQVQNQLVDHLGIDPATPSGINISALPFRAYAKIFNENYRDQDLVTPLPLSEGDGADTTTSKLLQNGAWMKDLYTSARPWTQKGPEVTIPLQGDAPIKGIGTPNSVNFAAGPTVPLRESGETSTTTYSNYWGTSGQNLIIEGLDNTPGSYPNIRADLSGVSAANINELRLAFALQRYEEARARYGSRYTEYLRYLGIRSSDARLQLPEYLGGGKQTITFSEVLQTAPGDTGEVGALKGHGISFSRSRRYRKFFEEHGIVMTLCCVRPVTMYPQSIPRKWNRTTKEMYFQRELQHIGQDEIYNKEVYGQHSDPNGVFGFNDRYDDYRRQESGVSGNFRTDLDFWHMARIFNADPTLNASFVTSNPTTRINAVTNEPNLWVMSQHSIQARRMLAKVGNSFIY